MKRLPLWLFAFALGARLLLIAVLGIDGLYGQDAFAYMNCAREILQTHWGEIPCGTFYWPLGYPLLAAMLMLLTHAQSGAQLASALAGAAIAPLAYWMTIEVGEAGRGDARSGVAASGGIVPGSGIVPGGMVASSAVAAGLIAALCGTLLLSSIVVMSDAAGLFWATLSACLLLRWSNVSVQPAWLLLAAMAFAMAVITRWIFAGLILPFGVFAAVATWHRLRTVRSQGRTLLHRSVIVAGLSWAGAALVFALVLVPQLYVNRHSGYPVSSDGWIVGWNPVNALRASFDTASGHFDYRLPPIIFNAEPVFHPAYLFPLLTPCVLRGAWQLRRSPAVFLLCGWIITLYLYLIGTTQENMRFGLAFFTPVAVLAGVGIFTMPARLRLSHRWVLLAVCLLLAIPFSYRVIAAFNSAAALQFSAIRFLQSQLPPAATVVTFELSISLQHYTDFTVVDLFGQSPESLRLLVCRGPSTARTQNTYLYVDTAKLESQWAGKSPAIGFHWLRDHIGLTQVGQQGTWMLYRVKSCSQ